MPIPALTKATGPARWLALPGAGALAPLGFAPFGLWPLTLLSMLLFLALLQAARRPLIDGWLYGLGFFGLGVSWVYVSIHQFGHASPLLAGLLTALFVAALALLFGASGWLLARLQRRLAILHPAAILLSFPALWVLSEWFRSVFLTGFPWLLSGYAPLDSWLAGWAPLTGVFGISYLMALCAAALWLPFNHAGISRYASGLILLGITLGSYGLTRHPWVQVTPARLPVALVQGNVDQNLKWQPRERDAILQRHIDPTLAQSDARLVVWPETAIPMLLDQAQPRLRALDATLQARDIGLISGVASREAGPDRRWHYHNSIVGLGNASGLYHKQRLVPFGEYVPLEAWLRGLIEFFDLPMSSFSLGPADQPPLHSQGFALAPFICYEMVYPELVRSAALRSDFLLTISNDAWFGDSLAPHQHLQMARMRALENGRQTLRGTNNGISALIDHQGKVMAAAPQFVATVLRGELQQVTGTTPFTRLGSAPVLLGCALSLMLLWLRATARKRRQRVSTSPRSR